MLVVKKARKKKTSSFRPISLACASQPKICSESIMGAAKTVDRSWIVVNMLTVASEGG